MTAGNWAFQTNRSISNMCLSYISFMNRRSTSLPDFFFSFIFPVWVPHLLPWQMKVKTKKKKNRKRLETKKISGPWAYPSFPSFFLFLKLWAGGVWFAYGKTLITNISCFFLFFNWLKFILSPILFPVSIHSSFNPICLLCKISMKEQASRFLSANKKWQRCTNSSLNRTSVRSTAKKMEKEMRRAVGGRNGMVGGGSGGMGDVLELRRPKDVGIFSRKGAKLLCVCVFCCV